MLELPGFDCRVHTPDSLEIAGDAMVSYRRFECLEVGVAERYQLRILLRPVGFAVEDTVSERRGAEATVPTTGAEANPF